jgi:hypothetical protein
MTSLEKLVRKIKEINKRKQWLETVKGPPTCCGGTPLTEDGKCPVCGDKL